MAHDRSARAWFVRLLARAPVTAPGSSSVERAANIDGRDLAAAQHDQMFAAAVVHELRTPLAALSGEVELALRRERTPAAYRAALKQIGDRVAELVDLTGDLAFLGHPATAGGRPSKTASLAAAFASLAERYDTERGVDLVIESAVTIVGDEPRLTRALALLVEHALTHRRDRARVRLRAVRADDDMSESGDVDLLLDAGPEGFPPNTWHQFTASCTDISGLLKPGGLRLRTAARLVQDCGGSWDLEGDDSHGALRIRLRRARA